MHIFVSFVFYSGVECMANLQLHVLSLPKRGSENLLVTVLSSSTLLRYLSRKYLSQRTGKIHEFASLKIISPLKIIGEISTYSSRLLPSLKKVHLRRTRNKF